MLRNLPCSLFPVPCLTVIGTTKQSNYNFWFSHDVTKIQTKKLSILLSFHFHEVLEYPNTFIYTNFRFERVIRFVDENDYRGISAEAA